MDYETQRRHMLLEIEAEARLTKSWTGRGQLDRKVMQAIASVPRHEFVPDQLRARAYDNGPLPIGQGQTISQPFVVALMTDLLDLGPESVVLDVGTGSGYQAAVLSRIAIQVYGIETVPELGRQAAARLARLGLDNVDVAVGDGYQGRPEHAPYDGIVVAAAVPEIPAALLDQLRVGGRLVAPVGDAVSQDLRLLVRGRDGKLTTRSILPVVFVPLVAAGGTGY